MLATIIFNWYLINKRKNVLALLEGIDSFAGDYGNINNKDNFRKYFSKYTKPTFISSRFRGEEENKTLSFKELFKYLIDKKDRRRVLMIYAETGMGKSRLLRFLVYKILLHEKMKKNENVPINTLPFVGHGIFYSEFNIYSSIVILIDEIMEIKK